MKKILTASILATVLTASMSASAWWSDNNSRYNGNLDNRAYNSMNGTTYGNGWGDGSGDLDMDGDFEMTIKAKARGRGRGNTKYRAYGNADGYSTNTWRNDYNGDFTNNGRYHR